MISRWIFISPDQLNSDVGLLAASDPVETGVVLIESRWWARRRKHHKQKIALVFANLRHFADELGARGFTVRYESSDHNFAESLQRIAHDLGTRLVMMEPASRELRTEIEPLIDRGIVEFVPNEFWLTSEEDFEASQSASGPPWRMDRFYRHIRRTKDILMQDGKPVGGRFSFDGDNREPWPGHPVPPVPPEFPIDPIKTDVCALVDRECADHPGRTNVNRLPATRSDAEEAWGWAL
jgi:deoxyribodipyrimidine photolyase-related protein